MTTKADKNPKGRCAERASLLKDDDVESKSTIHRSFLFLLAGDQTVLAIENHQNTESGGGETTTNDDGVALVAKVGRVGITTEVGGGALLEGLLLLLDPVTCKSSDQESSQFGSERS